MPRAAFTQASIQRAVSALEGMGKTVRGVEVRRDGSILVLVDTGEPPRETSAPEEELPTCAEVFGCDT